MSLSSPTPHFDPSAAEAFMARAADIVNSGALAVMMSIGHKTGLFDTMADLEPSTSHVIAQKAKLAERYVREWLAAMVTGGFVVYDPAQKTYALPPEHAACLTRKGPLGNLASYGQFVALMGEVQTRVIACFETGAGTAYADYPCFHEVMAEDSAQTVAACLFEILLPLADGMIERLEAGADVLDAGCGRGGTLIAMAKQFPASRFTGYDLCADAIEFAKAAAGEAKLDNIRFDARDLTGYAETERFDFITTFDAVHDQKTPQGLIASLYGALKPGGLYLMQDIGGSAHLENNIDFPMASYLYAISCMHCMPISLGQGGAGLGTMWGFETAEAMLREAGFGRIARHNLPHDPHNVWFVSRKD